MNTHRSCSGLYRVVIFSVGLVATVGFAAPLLHAQHAPEHVDPTWLHRLVSAAPTKDVDFTSSTCRYKPLFGEGDSDTHVLQTVVRFGEASVAGGGECGRVDYPRQEELYFILSGNGTLHYRSQSQPLRKYDFTYLPPGAEHWLSASGGEPLVAVVMTYKIAENINITPAPENVRVANLDSVKEQPVEGHPLSVLYKLLVGPREGTRDTIDAGYVVTSLFWMDFSPNGTNTPHHHQLGEEIYLIIDGRGDIVAGGGINGVEGRHHAGPGEAWYFRPNCTVGFYNRNAPGAKAYILAVRSKVPVAEHSAD